MHKVAGRMANIAIFAAWSRWLEMVDKINEQRVKVARVLGKMMHRQLAAAFERWYEWFEVNVMARRKAEAGLAAVQVSTPD